jgi:predicted kinase
MNDAASNKTAPYLIITCGLTGTGKSTIINEVVKEMAFTILASDRVRKQLVGISPEEHKYEEFDEGIYSKELTEKTYLRMIEEGKKIILEGQSVVLDACFPKKWQRQKAFDAAKEANAQFLCIEFICPEEVVRKRLERRLDSKEGISDGRWEIYCAQKETFDKIDDLTPNFHFVIDSSKPIEDSKRKIIERLES